MLRRHAIASLLAAGAWAKGIDEYFEGGHGAAVLVDRKSRRLLATHDAQLAGAARLPPGSTLKPLVLNALLERRLLREDERFPARENFN